MHCNENERLRISIERCLGKSFEGFVCEKNEIILQHLKKALFFCNRFFFFPYFCTILILAICHPLGTDMAKP